MKYHPKRTDEEWSELIQQCRASGLGDYLWCQENHVPTSSFYRAVGRLRIGACSRSAGLAAHQDVVSVRYEDLKETGGIPEAVMPSASDALPGTIRLCLGNVSMELTNGAAPSLVDAVIRSLRSQCQVTFPV